MQKRISKYYISKKEKSDISTQLNVFFILSKFSSRKKNTYTNGKSLKCTVRDLIQKGI